MPTPSECRAACVSWSQAWEYTLSALVLGDSDAPAWLDPGPAILPPDALQSAHSFGGPPLDSPDWTGLLSLPAPDSVDSTLYRQDYTISVLPSSFPPRSAPDAPDVAWRSLGPKTNLALPGSLPMLESY